MPRSFSGGGGWSRRPDPKLFSVPQQQRPAAFVPPPPPDRAPEGSNADGGIMDDTNLQSFVDFLISSDPELGGMVAAAPASALAPPQGGDPSVMMDVGGEEPSSEPIKMMEVAEDAPVGLLPARTADPFSLSPACAELGLPPPPFGIVMPTPKTPWTDSGSPGATPTATHTPIPAPAPAPPIDQAGFDWSECGNLITTDALGAPLRVPGAAAWPAVQLAVRLQMPLLYWKERRRWMWHKKWALPKIHISVTLNGQRVDAAGAPPLSVIVSAGTLRDDGRSLNDSGLTGECQRHLVDGECTLSSLFFQHTSFNCGNRPFHLVANVIAPAHHPLAIAALQRGAGEGPGAAVPEGQSMVALACVCSSPIVVDARKRTKGERPDAAADDVRVMQRHRGSSNASSNGEASPRVAQQQAQQKPIAATQPPFGAPANFGQGPWQQPPQQQNMQQQKMHPHQHQHQRHQQQQQQMQMQMQMLHQQQQQRQQAQQQQQAQQIQQQQLLQQQMGAAAPSQWPQEGPIELAGELLLIKRILSRTAFGLPATDLANVSVLALVHPDDQMRLIQTARELLVSQESQGVVSGKFFRMFYRSPTGQTELAAVEMSLTALRTPMQDAPATLLMSARRVG